MPSPVIRKTLLAVVIVLAVGLSLTVGRATEHSIGSDVTYEKLKLLSEVLDTIQSKYVDKPDPDALITGAIKGMVSSLDPHSSFLTPDEFKELQIETSGKFSGIGIEISIRDGILTVVSPIEGTPAYQVGLQAGDKIIKVDGKLTKQMTLMDAVKAIRGPKGSEVVLTIMRAGVNRLLDFKIVRDVIPIVSVKSRLLEPGYGYLRIATFQAGTSQEVKDALAKLDKPGRPLKGLILDLRNNPGGLLNQAVDVSDIWLNGGLIVYTKGRISDQDYKFYAKPNNSDDTYPMVVLVNQGSASASEIVAGALKDHHRAVIMGVKTFGKGSVQTIIPFGGNSGLRLTTARYYTPSGVSIQAKGIEPDIKVEFVPPPKKKKNRMVREADLANHLEAEGEGQPAAEAKTEAEAKAKPDKKTKQTKGQELLARDNQVREAFNLLKAWSVFSAAKANAK